MELLRYAPHLNTEKLKVKQDEFRFMEMASRAKQKVGGKVTGCALNLGEFVTRVNLYVTILGSYDVVIGMDWMESHEVILNCKIPMNNR